MTKEEKNEADLPEELPENTEESDLLNEENAESENDGENTEDENSSVIEQLKNEIKETHNTLLRERADFINFRRRSRQDAEDLEKRVAGKILTDILPAFDAFDQLFSSNIKFEEGSFEKFIEGAKLIRKQLWNSFSTLGVEEFDPAGQEFDPVQMEALSVEESSECSSEVVKSVYQKGYRIGEKVLRPARVGVMKPAVSKKDDSAKDEKNLN